MKLGCLFFVSLTMLASPLNAQTVKTFTQLPLGRDASLPIASTVNTNATVTLILLPGGDAGSGDVTDGNPSSQNFLVRTREQFADQGFNVIVAFRPTDRKTMDYEYRTSSAHIEDMRRLVIHGRLLGKPLWIVGTSRGTVSALAAGLELGSSMVDGIVLTASVTNRKSGAIDSQRLSKLSMPFLVVHHKKDACKICDPDEASNAVAKATSRMKKYLEITGGHSPVGDPCQALHFHGFVNSETETVKLITDWIKQPTFD